MRLRKQVAVIAAALAATSSLVCGQAQPAAAPARNQPLVGVWQVLRHGVDCNTGQDLGNFFSALMTFHADGTMTADTGAVPGATSEYGVWQRESGSQTYSFRDTGFEIDENGHLADSGIITASLTLTSASTFSYTATIQFFDADGNLLFTICGRADGTRFQ